MAEPIQYKVKEYAYTWQIEDFFNSLNFRSSILTPIAYISSTSWIKLKLNSWGKDGVTLKIEKSPELELSLGDCELDFCPAPLSTVNFSKRRASELPGWKIKWGTAQVSRTTAVIKCFLFLRESLQAGEPFPYDDYHVLKLSRDVGKLLESGSHSDLTLEAKDQKFKVHRVILESRAPALVKLLRLDRAHIGEKEVDIMSPEVLGILLDFWYTGKLDVSARDLPIGLSTAIETLRLEDLQGKLCVYPNSTSATTRVTTVYHDLQWPLKDFTSLLPRKEVISPVFYFPLYSEFQLKVMLNSSVDLNGETKMEVHFLWHPNYVACNCVLQFKTSFVDALGDKNFECSFDGQGVMRYQKILDIDKSELEAESRFLLPNGTLTLHCEITLQKMEHSLSGSVYSSAAVKDQTLSCKDFSAYSDDLGAFCDNEKFSDMTVATQDRRFFAHKSIISVRCPQFLIQHQPRGGVCTIHDVEPNVMLSLLKYLYSGRVELVESGIAFKLYLAAFKYDLFLLKETCLAYLRSNLTFKK